MKLTKQLSFQTGPASPRTTAIAMAFVASILLVATVFAAYFFNQLHATGTRTQGEVVRYVETSNDMYSAVFQFADEYGQLHQVLDRVRSSRKKYEVGESVAIVYKPDDPTSARKVSTFSMYLAPVALGLASLLFYGGAALVWRNRSSFQKEYEARRSRTVVTVVDSDGSVRQTIHSSVPVFRWTARFLTMLGISVWIGGAWFLLRALEGNEQAIRLGVLVYIIVMGAALLLGAALSFRHASFLKRLEDSPADA